MATKTEQQEAATPASKPPPRQRKKRVAAAPPVPDAREQFHERAQTWLRGREDKVVTWPGDLAEVTKLGVPCGECGVHVHRLREDGHSVFYRRVPGAHWAAGVTVECRRA
jgi:hypothetical protein